MEGRPAFTVSVGAAGLLAATPEERADFLWLGMGVVYSNTDRGADLFAEPDNIIDRRLDGFSGSLRFARLAPTPHGPPCRLPSTESGKARSTGRAPVTDGRA